MKRTLLQSVHQVLIVCSTEASATCYLLSIINIALCKSLTVGTLAMAWLRYGAIQSVIIVIGLMDYQLIGERFTSPPRQKKDILRFLFHDSNL